MMEESFRLKPVAVIYLKLLCLEQVKAEVKIKAKRTPQNLLCFS